MTIKLLPKGTGHARLTEAVTSEYGQLIELVRQAVRDKLRLAANGDYYVDVRGIWPEHVVVAFKGRMFRYGYTVSADNTVVVGEATEVVADFQPVSAAPAAPVLQPAAVNVTEALGHPFREAADGSIHVRLIQAGRSGNRNYYPDSALREAAPMFEGVRVFAKSDADHLAGKGKDVRSLIGGIYGVRFVEGKTPDTGALVGAFKALDPTDAVVIKMTEAVKRGMQGLLGLSIDADARTKPRKSGTETLREAVKFTKVHSVDLIVEPGAGGGLDRLTEAAADQPTTPEGNAMPLWKQRLLEAIKAKDPAKFATIDAAKIGDDELVNLHEAVCAPFDPAPPGTQRVTEAQGDNTPVTRADLQVITLRQAAHARIAAARLPQAAKERLQAQIDTIAAPERLTEAAVGEAIKAEGAYIARMTESGAVRVPLFGDGAITVGDRSLTMREMLDAFWDPAHKDHRSVQSFKECYIEITGDRRVTGDLRNCDMGRLAESLGSFRESIDSTTLADALGDSITRRMQTVYTGLANLDAWKKVATYGPVNDFRSVERVRIGGYGNLPAVAQGAPYVPLASPGDDKATYAVTKRGGTEDVTLEAIKNDDVQALRRIPVELALAAKNTLYEFVFDFFRTNPVIYDTKALYHVDHGNLFTAALSAAEFAMHRLAMLKQTRAGSGKRLATAPAIVMVPFELEETAYNLFVRNQNLDKTFVQTINPEVIPINYWTDGNDWVTAASPTLLPALEIGFLDGREDPELFVQDAPTVGSMFSNDKLTYKIRHIYGGSVLVDGFKATTKAVVPA
ncbi:hypothetical protein SAMN05192589_107118 [Paracidovorax valerianellae]|uniref:Prohead serine protease n=1 Tax=Paracidovorax valerianellae TaxID=187868 RepID=A0A1G6VT83_9BURK|nr:hypothetical protein [Paracidovorax valerianellae]SDD56207.1 hypothetical protein SAMN05192589_107118 [Paracidovorax valerianellae]